MKTKYKYIQFTEMSSNSMGILWQCLNNRSKDVLAVVTFYEPWKQHVAQFSDTCVFNNQCLIDIADFLGRLNKEEIEK